MTQMIAPKINGKDIVGVARTGTMILSVKLEDGTELQWNDIQEAVENGNSEGLMLHETPTTTGKILSTVRGSDERDYINLDDIPEFRENPDNQPVVIKLDGQKVVGIKVNDDDTVVEFKLEDGNVVDKDQAFELVQTGKGEGLVAHENNVGAPVLSATRDAEPSSLFDLPKYQ